MKSMGIKDVLAFPYITRPRIQALQEAIQHLAILGALEFKNKDKKA